MAKYFVAPTEEQKGKGKMDFSFTMPGEPVVIGSKCDGETPSGGCGCRRAVSGLSSRKGTTIAVVADVEMTAEEIARQDASFNGTFDHETIEAHKQNVEILMEIATKFKIGARVGFAFDGDGMKAFGAGDRKDWGI